MKKIALVSDSAIFAMGVLPFHPGVICALRGIQDHGFEILILSERHQEETHLAILGQEGIHIKEIEPTPEAILLHLKEVEVDYKHSYFISRKIQDRSTAEKLGVHFLSQEECTWEQIAYEIKKLKDRLVEVRRKTKETDISIELNLDGSGRVDIHTGIPFFDHMLEQIARHGKTDLKLSVQGDLEIDEHHTVEDTAITLGQALKKAIGDKRGIGRYGFYLPMDESLVSVALDFSGRPILVYEAQINREKVGDLPVELVKHFWESLCQHAGINLNMKIDGENAHHMIEGGFKAFAKALAMAVKREGHELPSTKGSL